MGYDFEIADKCSHCGRSDNDTHLYTSYNHSWAFYEYLDQENGLRGLYGKKGKETTEPLETMLECLEYLDDWDKNCDNYPQGGDGWAITAGNAYYFAKRILETAQKHPEGIWSGD